MMRKELERYLVVMLAIALVSATFAACKGKQTETQQGQPAPSESAVPSEGMQAEPEKPKDIVDTAARRW